MLNICVSGATGWTGRELVRGVLEAEDMTLASAVARQAAGQDVGAALAAIGRGVSVVLGTTGLTAADFEEIDAAARVAGVGVAAGNFCLTAALL